jgi:membrane carboxypeptidase/penicillin-binding protein
VGFDRDRPLRDQNGVGITGGRGAAPIWARFMKQAMEGEPARDFTMPEDIHLEVVDPQTGRPPDNLSRETIEVALTDGQAASGVVVETRPEVLFVEPRPEQASPPPPRPANEGIMEEDLPKGD